MKASSLFPLLKGKIMADECATVKVKPWGKGQGDFVEINAEDFDAEKHELFEGEVAPIKVSTEEAAKVIGDAEALLKMLTPEQRDELQALMIARAKDADEAAKLADAEAEAKAKAEAKAAKAAKAEKPVEKPVEASAEQAKPDPNAGWGGNS